MLPKSPEEFHQKLGLIFHALLAIPLALFIYLFLELRHNNPLPILNNKLLLVFATYSLPILGVLLGWIGYRRWRRNLSQINREDNLPVMLSNYGKSMTNFYYYTAASSAIWVLGLYLTTSYLFIAGYVVLLFFMSLQRPTPKKYVEDLNLTGENRNIILQKKEFGDS